MNIIDWTIYKEPGQCIRTQVESCACNHCTTEVKAEDLQFENGQDYIWSLRPAWPYREMLRQDICALFVSLENTSYYHNMTESISGKRANLPDVIRVFSSEITC